jgi:hypothetical protein
MKTQQKIKKIPTKRASKQSNRATPAVVLVHAQRPVMRHFRLVDNRHTGKLIHHRHTSHVALTGLLVLVGIFMYITAGFARVQADAGTVSIGVIVPGPAPTVGATITTPKNGLTIVDQYVTQVTGTCAQGTFVAIQNNSELVGSTVCTAAGMFFVQVQLQLGVNVLSALNYDNLNQAGPVTALVSVTVNASPQAQPLELATSSLPVILPANPSVIPGVTPAETSSCETLTEQALTTGGVPRVAVVCIPRFVQASTSYTLGITAWGGVPPYALDVNLGDKSDNTLLSLATPGSKALKFSYASAGIYTITIKLKDREGKSAIVQTAVQTTGGTKTPLAVIASDVTNTSWFRTPVPLYLIAVAITLGFWGGDFFDRNFGAHKSHRTARKAV